MSTNTSSRRAYRTPDTASTALRSENAKSRVRQQQRLGDLGIGKRIPLSPSKRGSPAAGAGAPSSKVDLDGLVDELDGLAVSPSKSKHPLAAPPTTAAEAKEKVEQARALPPIRSAGTRLKSLSNSTASSSATAPPKNISTLASSSTSATSTTSDKSAGSAANRPYKPIDDYASPIQLLTRDPDWEALAPQGQHGMLGLHGDTPLNLTGTVGVGGDEWGSRKAVVSESTMKQARDLSRNNVPGAGNTSNPSGAAILENDGREGPDADRGVDGGDDRFLGHRDADGGFHAGHSLAAPRTDPSTDPTHDHQLRDALSIEPDSQRILAFAQAAPRPREDPTFAMQRELVQPIYARPGAVGGANGVYTNKARRIPTVAERILDAPGMINDYYLNLIAWSASNVVGVALRESVYIWNAETNETELLSTCEDENSYVSSVDFSADGSYAGVGIDNGNVEIWDVETRTRLRSMAGHQAQISVLSWNNHVISSGCADGSIWHHDVRVGNHKVMELLGHTGEVCGLKWRSDGDALASGGNDNVVNCWDGRVGGVGEGSRGQVKWTKSTHTAAVKAIAWAPWNPNILASGGGTSDCRINIWSTNTGSRLHTILTPAQVTSIQFSPHSKEIFSTHGFPTNALMIHSYPALEKIAEIRDAHDARILNSAVSPDGDLVVTNSGDENIKFWRIWDLPVTSGAGSKKAKKDGGSKGVEREMKSIR